MEILKTILDGIIGGLIVGIIGFLLVVLYSVIQDKRDPNYK